MKKINKIGVIGAGSMYSPELIDGFIKRKDELPVSEIVLMDIDETNLNITGNLAKRMVKRAGIPTKITITTDRKKALEGSDFVVTQIRVGGLDGRARDENIPLEFGVIGQETTGPGGFCMALRTIPVVLEIAREMEKLSPEGLMINFTNPSGLITEAITRHSNIQVIGLCNAPLTYQMRFAELFNVSRDDIWMDYFGLNHLSWIRKVYVKGIDKTDIVMEKIINGEAEDLPGFVFNKKLLKALGMMPNGYLMHFYHGDRILKHLRESKPRAEVVKRVNQELMDIYSDPTVDEKPKVLEQRGGAWYSDAAVALISAIVNDKKEIHIVNVPNQGVLPSLPNDCIVEVPALVKQSGVYPIAQDDMPLSVRGLVQIVKTYEQLTIEAAVEGSWDKALLALVNHPLVPDADTAERLLDRLIEDNKEFLPQF